MQSVIDPIQTLIENGRQAAAAREAERAAKRKAQEDAERRIRDEAWTALETAVAQQLPAEIAKYALPFRTSDRPGSWSAVTIDIEHLHPFVAMFTQQRAGWSLAYFRIERRTVTGEVDSYYRAKFEPNELHLCLAEVARLTEWQAARKTAVLDYEVAVAKWHWEHTNKSALIEAMTEILQKQVCEDHGDSFALWQIHYSYFEDGEVQTGTAVVLENETDALGFWRVVDRVGQVRRIAYANVFAVEDLGDWQVTQKEYTRRHYSRTFGTIYLPPYVTEEEFAASGKMVDLAQAAAPELTERPRPHDMEAAVLFEDWELDWLYHNTGGDADN